MKSSKEHQRSDSVCDAKKWKQNAIYDSEPGIEYVGGDDPNSAMDYCNSDDASFSQRDIDTINRLYPTAGKLDFSSKWTSSINVKKIFD